MTSGKSEAELIEFDKVHVCKYSILSQRAFDRHRIGQWSASESPFDITREYKVRNCFTKYIARARSSLDFRDSASYWRNHWGAARCSRSSWGKAHNIGLQDEEARDLPTATTTYG
jgi:hypothetical protein